MPQKSGPPPRHLQFRRHLVVEGVTQAGDVVTGTAAKYPRQKLLMTSPVEFPIVWQFKKMQLSKENLLAFWDMILNRSNVNVSTGEKVDDVKPGDDGIFTVITGTNQYCTRAVILAPEKLVNPANLA